MDRTGFEPTSRCEGVDLGRVLDAMPAAFGLLDPQGRFRYVNEQAEELLGRPRSLILGRTVAEIRPESVGGVF